MRVVDLSLGGAAIEGAFRDPISGGLKLQIEWFGVILTVDCCAARWALDDIPPRVHVAFKNVTNTQSLLLKALVGAMAAEQPSEEEPPRQSRKGWLRLVGR